LIRDRSITHLPLPSYKIYTAQLKATASPRQKRHRARAPLKVLKNSLSKFRFSTTNYRHLKPIPRFTRPREEKNYSRAPLGARESNSSKTTVTSHEPPLEKSQIWDRCQERLKNITKYKVWKGKGNSIWQPPHRKGAKYSSHRTICPPLKISNPTVISVRQNFLHDFSSI